MVMSVPSGAGILAYLIPAPITSRRFLFFLNPAW